MMQYRPLGRSGLDIAPIVFGGNVLGWTADRPTSFQLLDQFLDRGFNALDTADIYSAWVPGHTGGESETMLGSWLAARGRREEVVLMSKVGVWDKRKGLSAANIEAAVEDSLRRLRTDYLDIYFAHRDDPKTPLEETLRAFERLVESGKVRAIGASNYQAPELREALEVSAKAELSRYEVVQPQYNLYDRNDFEAELAELAREQDLGVVCYFALASGFLTGKYERVEDLDDSARAQFVKRYFDERGLRILDALTSVARELSTTPTRVALAWLLSRPAVTAPIASATSSAQLDEVLGAVDLSIPPDALARLDDASQ